MHVTGQHKRSIRLQIVTKAHGVTGAAGVIGGTNSSTEMSNQQASFLEKGVAESHRDRALLVRGRSLKELTQLTECLPCKHKP